MRPIIGITGNYSEAEKLYSLRDYYVLSVNRAGGIGIVLPPVEDEGIINSYISICNGFILSGGGDMDPHYWRELPSWDVGEINPLRDSFEIMLTQKILGGSIPVLGICRGCQVLNVVAGGSLVQNIDTFMCHQQNAPRNYPFHDIVIEGNSHLYTIINRNKIRVNSFHHQAVDQPGNNMRVSAWAADGTIEAIESKKHRFVIGVQWHPECMTDRYSFLLFKALTDACSSRCK